MHRFGDYSGRNESSGRTSTACVMLVWCVSFLTGPKKHTHTQYSYNSGADEGLGIGGGAGAGAGVEVGMVLGGQVGMGIGAGRRQGVHKSRA